MDEEFVFEFKKQIVPFLVQILPQPLFEAGREEELFENIVEAVLPRLFWTVEKKVFPITHEESEKLLLEIMEAMPGVSVVLDKPKKIKAIGQQSREKSKVGALGG